VEFISAEALAYTEKYCSAPDPLLEELGQLTAQNHPKAHMLSGKVQGRFLSLISKMLVPNRILEIGTFTGYSALCLAEGLSDGGQIHTIELREADAQLAASYFNRSKWLEKIILHSGNALEIIPGLHEDWDLVFIDADKVHYVDYYDLVLPRLRKGGIIIADNVLFHGEVLKEPLTGKNARAIQAFNDRVAQDDTVEKLMLTVRDGLLVIRKK
jgi:caffeoyl-CoA O-methyltransferase